MIRFILCLLSLLPLIRATDVFAHFMVGNTYAYDVDQWLKDMYLAKNVGIDGFMLNFTPIHCRSNMDMDWILDRTADAYTAAEQAGFLLAPSLDMSWPNCDEPFTHDNIEEYIRLYAHSSASYHWNHAVLVTTYGGDDNDQYSNFFFRGLKSRMDHAGIPISVVPALTTYSYAAQYKNADDEAARLMTEWPDIDGYKNWQAWPLDVDRNTSLAADIAFQSAQRNAGRSGPYIMTVSPWQFKDNDNGNKWDAWVQYSDTLFPDRWRAVATATAEHRPDIVEIISWNDFCESHYIRDLPSDSPDDTDYVVLGDMGRYVDRQPHGPWRAIARHYIHHMRNGRAPAPTEDRVVFWHRLHRGNAQCAEGSDSIRNSDYPTDALFAWASLAVSGTVTLELGSGSTAFYVNAADGPRMVQLPFPSDSSIDGLRPKVAIYRFGRQVRSCDGPRYLSETCEVKNFNPVVGGCGSGFLPKDVAVV